MIRKKNILLILPEDLDQVEFCSMFTRDNYTRLVNTEEEGAAFLEQHCDIVSAVVLDIRLARESEFRYVKQMCENPRFASIPIVAVSPDAPTEEDMICLELGVTDLITPPCPWPLLSRRIFNAIRAKDSATYYEIEDMLEKLPCNIFLKDTEGKYIFSTHYWRHIKVGSDPNWTIRGKTDLEVRHDPENARKAYESDLQIVKTGKGIRYVIEENEDGIQEFLELVKQPVYDADGRVKGIIGLVNDVTELECLRRQRAEDKQQ